jgi:iron(III) transport system permease protein
VGNYLVTNPLNMLYGTMAILVISNIVHFYTVSFLAATTALKQLDKEFEAVGASLGVPFYRTFWRITVPICLPTLLEIAMYYFVNGMVTVSAVIFLYSPSLKLASVAVVNMDDAGQTASAAAMSVLIVATCLSARALYGVATAGIERRTQAWRQR